MSNKPPLDDDDMDLFMQAVAGVTPIVSDTVPEYKEKPKSPVRQKELDEQQVIMDSINRDYMDTVESGEELLYVSNGINRQHVKRLKRGQFQIDHEIDLHGMTRDAAESALQVFYQNALNQEYRVIRIIHGKGYSSEAHPVLKSMVAHWLPRHAHVLAFCSAPPTQGGTGAVLVLLKKKRN